jgi:WD40 repeat protein
MGKSPDGCIICTASADETLRFWDIFSSSSESGINSIRSQPGNFHRSEPIPLLGSVISPVTRLRMLENTPNGSLSIR